MKKIKMKKVEIKTCKNNCLYIILALFTYLFYISVFIYSMPGYKCPIKERMLYSSCKGTFISQLEHTLDLQLEKKVCISQHGQTL